MSLDKIEKDLYEQGSNIENRKHDGESFNINETINIDRKENVFEEKKDDWNNQKEPFLTQERKKALLVGGLVLAGIFLLVGIVMGVFIFKAGSFSEDRVVIAIKGSETAKSIQSNSYIIKYENDNRVGLENVEIILNHSENFYPEENNFLRKKTDRSSQIILREIKPREKGEIEITGKFYAAEDYTVYLQPAMTYKPTNSSSEFRADGKIGVKITTSPINLEIIAPKEALDESTAEYKISYRNMGTIPFDGLNLRLSYSEGFVFQGASPAPIEGENVWHIGRLDVGEEKSVLLQGKIEGDQFDVKYIKGTIYKNENGQQEIVFGKAEQVTKVVVPPLAINHKINQQEALNINAGEQLKYEINYANNGSIALRDIIVKLKIDSPLVDYGNLDLENGAYESQTKTITWKATGVRNLENLEPGASGTIKLTVPIKNRVEISSEFDENFILESIVTIDSSDIAYHALGASKNISNKVIAKLNSKVILGQEIFFTDNVIGNSGPVPPKVGEETTYTVHWKVANVSNDISETKVKSSLPTWVKWKGKIVPDNENIKFNERTQEVVWDIGKVNNSVGILSEPKEVVFQIGVVPEINQVGEEVLLMSETILNAKDDFTANSIEEILQSRTNNLKEDPTVINNKQQVGN